MAIASQMIDNFYILLFFAFQSKNMSDLQQSIDKLEQQNPEDDCSISSSSLSIVSGICSEDDQNARFVDWESFGNIYQRLSVLEAKVQQLETQNLHH